MTSPPAIKNRPTAIHPNSGEARIIHPVVGPVHVPTVPMRVKAPVVALMLYIETLFEPKFVT
jgi:hypothetical protein